MKRWIDLSSKERDDFFRAFYRVWAVECDLPDDQLAFTPWGAPWEWCPDYPACSPESFFFQNLPEIRSANF